ncbi:MAG TPA: porin [Myxococcota bacterium]|jgi:phosphate-selective porin OprO/OprP
MQASPSRWQAAAIAIALLAAPPAARAEMDAETAARFQALEQELATVKRKLEVKEEADDAKAKLTPIVGAGKDGFFLRSPDGKAFQLRLRGYVQADTRWFEHGDSAGNDTFALRRVRPIFEGTLLENIDFRIMPDFAGGSPTLFDAYINLKYLPEAQLQIGKFKSPIGLERLQSATANTFVERGLPTFLVPTRDLGVQVWSDLREGMFSYAIGAFNGARDSGNADLNDIDTNDAKDVAARVFTQPFLETNWEALRGFGIGMGFSYGNENNQAAPSFRLAYDSGNFFAYRGATTGVGALPAVQADGAHLRLAPQGTWYWGPFGLLWEYTLSRQRLERGAGNRVTAANQSWQVAASYVLTGENATFKGVVPRADFAIDGSGWGAFELAARYGQLRIDHDVFPFYADPAVAARGLDQWTIGANWYLNRWLRIVLNFENNTFNGGAAPVGTDADRHSERVFLTRVQVNY